MAGRKSSRSAASRNRVSNQHASKVQAGHGKNEFVSFFPDSTAVIDETPDAQGGWSAEEMFKRNKQLGVASTFKDDLTQYTTYDFNISYHFIFLLFLDVFLWVMKNKLLKLLELHEK